MRKAHFPGFDPYEHLQELIALAVAEDVGSGDVTSNSLIPADLRGTAVIIAREPLLVCGNEAARAVCAAIGADALDYKEAAEDGTAVKDNETIAVITGPMRTILTAERVLLNFMQRLSGIATYTRKLRETMNNKSVKILDTRKTTPGWRSLEKYAVFTGGGTNHRLGLYDAFLIKNNHIDAFGGDVRLAVEQCKRNNPDGLKVQVEVRSQAELEQAVAAHPDSILLDNMSLDALRGSVLYVRGEQGPKKIELEASGGINEKTIAAIAATGIDAVSIGALTHSAKAADISLRYRSGN